MGHVRVMGEESRMERGGAFCASLLFHVLLLLVLGSSSNFDIKLGERSRFDVVFWISPASAAPRGEPELPVEKTAPAPARQAAAAVTRRAAGAPAQQTLPRSPTAPRQATRSFPSDPPASLPPAGVAIVDAPADATLLLPPAARPAPASPTVKESVKERRVAASREQTVESAAKGVAGRHEPEQSPVAELPMPIRLGAFLELRSSAEAGTSGSHEDSAAATAKERPEAASAATGKPSATVERGETAPRGVARAHSAGAASQQEHPAPVRNAPPAEKPPEPRGIVATSLQGDLKMVISGDSGVRLLVLFREYPKSRRDRPLTRSEARREQRIQPVIARTNQETREAVIETARDGIYIFAAEPEHGDKAKATFTLKLFETGRRERTAEIGARTISGKTVLARVLMRDGVLWDDESAFTGSIEDSESTTKFNASTGLYWKEYHR